MRLVVELTDAYADEAGEQCRLPETLADLLAKVAKDMTDRDHDLAVVSTVTETKRPPWAVVFEPIATYWVEP